MGSTRDFLRSAMSDAMLPTVKQLLEDVVLEVLNDRQVPSRTDFRELRDLANTMRGQVGSASTGARKAGERVKELEARVAALEEALAATTQG